MCAKSSLVFFISHLAYGQVNPLMLVQTSSDYRQMLYVTRNNYSHFVRDLIWRSVIRDWGGEGDYEQANTNRRPVRLEQWMIDKEPEYFKRLERAGMQFEIVRAPNNELFSWNKLLHSVCGNFFEDDATCKALDFRFGDAFNTTKTIRSEKRRKRIVWLSRGTNQRRAISNEKFVYNALKSAIPNMEYLIINSSILKKNPMVKQAEMFTDVDVLVSLHGAGLTNMLYMPEDSLVVEIMPKGYAKDTYMNFAKRLKLRYKRLTADADGDKGAKAGKVSLSTRTKYAFNSKEDKERKFKRDVIIKLHDYDIDSLRDMLSLEASKRK